MTHTLELSALSPQVSKHWLGQVPFTALHIVPLLVSGFWSAGDWTVNNILLEGLQSKDCKPFWRYVKSKRQDTIGVAPLKSKGNLFSDSKSKATILNDQFKSVFTPTQDPD